MNILKRNIASQYKLGLTSKVKEFIQKVKNFETPEKLKGTIVERWGMDKQKIHNQIEVIFRFFLGIYWKNLCIDYKDVAIDVAKDCKTRPTRALVYASSDYHIKFF